MRTFHIYVDPPFTLNHELIKELNEYGEIIQDSKQPFIYREDRGKLNGIDIQLLFMKYTNAKVDVKEAERR